MLPVTVTCLRAGSTPVDVTARLDGQPTFSTAAVGGFADCTFTLLGDARRLVPYLSLVRITLGPAVLYEGQVEDADPSGSGDDLRTTVTCFGLRNLLVENSVRRIWSKRDIALRNAPGGRGAFIPFATSGSISIGDAAVSVGSFDQTDLTKTGARISGNGASLASHAGHAAIHQMPSGLVIVKVLGTCTITGANTGAGKLIGRLFAWQYGTSPASIDFSDLNTSGTFTFTPTATTCDSLGVSGQTDAVVMTPTAADTIDFYNLRILGTSLNEDASGGFYGGTILRDLIALVPSLTAGVIEDGSDFTIQALERAVRNTAMSVVEEVAGYYTREWAVWESGRFDWKTRALDDPDWIVSLADLSGLSLDGTLDGIARTVYVLYTDAASGLDSEASSASTSQRNPYVKQGRAKDLVVQAGFPMTSNTSAQLASRLAGDIGQWVPVQGSVTLPATKLVGRVGAAAPALMIRGGDNLLISDLPKTDLFQQGRDGETLFHIVSTTCDLAAGTVTLQLEGQSRRTDVLLARLAAVTRTLTGA